MQGIHMQLNVDFTELHLSAAKMQGLDSYLSALRNHGFNYIEGLQRATTYVVDNGGQVQLADDGVTELSLGDDTAYCFQPYEDIDRFYYEL
jgi:hypothetical protein